MTIGPDDISIGFPGMEEFEWVKQYKEVKLNSKTTPGGTSYRIPDPAPLSIVVQVIGEYLESPGVREIWKEHVGKYSFEMEVSRLSKVLLISMFDTYLKHKYGDTHWAVDIGSNFARRIVIGHYGEDVNMNKVIKDIMIEKSGFVYDDRD